MAESTHNGSVTATAAVAELKDRLNNLWTQYLTLLDQYDKAQKELSSHLSSVSFGVSSLLSLDLN